MSQDDAYQREPSTRAADPISRSLLATAERHQDHVNKADFFHLYTVNPWVDFAICVACLFPPVISWWFLGGMMTAVVILVEASLVLTIFRLAWRVGHRDKSPVASTTE